MKRKYQKLDLDEVSGLTGLSKDALGILLHCLGVQQYNKGWSIGGWRNYYSTNTGNATCERLRALGWMTGGAEMQGAGGTISCTFHVSNAAVKCLRLAGVKLEEP